MDILAGYQGQNVQNPTLPEAARKTGGLDFNMDANVNVLGNIGSKLKLPDLLQYPGILRLDEPAETGIYRRPG